MHRPASFAFLALVLVQTLPGVIGAYEHSGEFVRQPGAYVYTSAEDFEFAAMAGDLVEATLSWASGEPSDFALRIIAPPQPCDTACIVANTPGAAACSTSSGVAPDLTTRSLSTALVSGSSGVHRVSVVAQLNGAGTVDYEVSLSINGQTPERVAGPIARTYTNPFAYCSFVP